MKKVILMSILACVTLAGYSPTPHTLYLAKLTPFSPFETLWLSTCIVESSNNPMAYNAKEGARGLAQIRPIRIKDYNHRTGKNYSLSDCYDPKISREVFMYYASQFRHYEIEKISKAWNGRGKSNKIYWGKVKRQIINLENSK